MTLRFYTALALSVGAVLAADAVNSSLVSGLRWRSIGPAMFAGRVDDVAGVPGDPTILYVAGSTAGLFKSVNSGNTFESVFNDGNTLSVGAVAIAPDNRDVVYIGTGEGAVRNSTSVGDGIYKTTDAGHTWKHMGLTDTERFGRIIINPRNSNIVFAAAMGHEWGPNEERGIFRSTDGGATWKKVLYVNPVTGASDVCFDGGDPNIVYAGMYDYMRQPWHFRSGGPGSGLYRSADGGDTWVKLTDPALHNGLPGAKLLGRIGISAGKSNPAVVYAMIEAQEPGVLWRSDDHGQTWKMTTDNRQINNRPFYYTQIRVDPNDENRIYALAGNHYVSTDGGRNFRPVGGSIFGDHHALWIDPANSKRLLAGSDGGFFISNDQGAHWDFVNNMPMAQPYHVGVDMAEPYNVMGGFQDHEIWRGPNERWNQVGVREGNWLRLRNMADGMYAFADPRDPNIVYYDGHFGDLTRLDIRNQEERFIHPYPVGPAGAGANFEKYRFNWNSPALMSPTNPDVLYYGGNVLFKTTDKGENWTIISPDLSTNDPEKIKLSGGEISLDNTRAEFHCTITAIAESPKNNKVIWAGTDDGNVQLTTDGGAHWTNLVRNVGAPPNSWVPAIKASWVDAGTAYMAMDRHTMNDMKPYAFLTKDYGRTWTNIAPGLNGYVHIVMEDPKNPDLLYAGTEFGVFASFDKGAHWTDLRLGLPHISVVDMVVHPRENDLIIASHSRGFYILDDVTPLQQLASAMARPVTLFQPVRATRYTQASDTSVLGNRVWVAPNKPYGSILTYYLANRADSVNITVSDSSGRTLQSFQGPGNAGLNRAVWGLREDICQAPVAGRGGRGGRGGSGVGPRVLPGEYRVRLKANGETVETTAAVRLDPRIQASKADLDAYYSEVKRLYGMQCSIDAAVTKIRSIDSQMTTVSPQVTAAEVKAVVADLQKQLRAIENDMESPANDPEHENIRRRLTWLVDQVQNNTARPTVAQDEWIGIFEGQLKPLLLQLNDIVENHLPQLNQKLKDANLKPISPDAPAPGRGGRN
ncbi:MAG TPA: hypothetical protein VLY04_11140 [Bryobacteraceae bacterium]|nr:hypothetical protein [Bryobacteraceae bacterium]